jgi:type I restriction enzyme S subunit
MKLETFFEDFDELVDAPGGVKAMRELVLRLAFSGGLTAKRLTEAGVPDGWQNRTIESISASISSGFACSRSHQVDNGHVHLRTHNISTLGTLNFDLLVRIDPKMLDPKKASIRAGDILFNNTNSQELVGKTSLVDRDYDYGFSNHITRIRLKDGVFPGFVVFYLTLLRNSGYFARLCTRWINQAAVNTDTLKEQTIPLPPLAEQKRIVAKVDELMALCDRLEAQQQERETRHASLARASLARFADAPTPANLPFLFHPSYAIRPADLRKSILTLAVQGKLVPQDPNDELTLTLLDQIASHKEAMAKEGKLRGSTTVKSMADDEAEFEIPSNWCWVRFGEIMVNRDGERIPVSKEERETKAKTYDYYGASGIIDKIDGYLFDKPLLLIGEDGANLINRSTPIAFIARGKYWVNNHAHVLDGISEEFLQFIELHINAINLEKYITGSAQPKMNQAKMNSIPIALPPLAEQRRIVAKVDELMALVDALETQLAASRVTAANLLSALVAELTRTGRR